MGRRIIILDTGRALTAATIAQLQSLITADGDSVAVESGPPPFADLARRFTVTEPEAAQPPPLRVTHDEKAQWKREKNRHRRYYK